MRLDSSGNLGIGTSSPTFGSGDGLEIQRAGIATLRLENSSASNSFELYADSAANGINLRGRDSSPLVFWTANTERMRLDSSGNLGIGTTSPASRLHVNNATGIITYATIGNINGGTQVGADAAGASVLSSFAVNAIRFGQQSSTTFVETMRLDSSGNLGIGTSSPGHRLAVDVGAGAQNIFAAQQTGVSNGYTITSNGTNLTHSWHTAGSITAQITANGSFAAGAQGALATTATNGFLYVPTCSGTPTGTPTAITGLAPIVVDTTNNKLYFYSTGVWRDAGP
jgi:hypothetical protein